MSSAIAELVVLAVFLEILGDLRGELARRLEDQRARHQSRGRGHAARMSIIGSTKEAALPVPVWAMPIRSRFISTGGIETAGMGAGAV